MLCRSLPANFIMLMVLQETHGPQWKARALDSLSNTVV